MENKNIAFVFDDLTEFFVMQAVIDALKKKNIPVDIIVPSDSGYNGLAEHTTKKLENLGYSVHNKAPKNKVYQILFTPYPGLSTTQQAKYYYHIQYPYGAASSKPNPTFLPLFRMGYDAIISFNTYDQYFLDAYGCKVYPVPYWRYHQFKKEPRKTEKPTLLLLPTFGKDTSCIDSFTDKAIKEIKKYFHIIAKAHHATHFGRDKENTFTKLKNIADEFYDSDIPIDKLLKKADIVLSDNSGAIFESICANIPVILFAKNINSRHIKSINTLQYDLTKQGILPYAKQANQILPILLNIDTYARKQEKISKQLFLKIPNDPLKGFLDVTDHFLNLDKNDPHKIIHDIITEEWYTNKNTINIQQAKIQELNNQIYNLEEKHTNLLEYKKTAEEVFNSRAYKLFEKLITPYKKMTKKDNK